ncbi:unnamed protein product [Rotaria sordida]|uniref:Uncharacterized protein n=2 Tax=Rotaria sordida TaxID=392033 RepID=A0A815RFF7_9BILA|nr:unnamed protein product [Rotaria sordida]
MENFLCLISFILLYYSGDCIQPYFPSQIVFSTDNGQTIIVIDEINQRAYQSLPVYPSNTQRSFAMKNFPYSIPDSPQSKYYVELIIDSSRNICFYETYWKYGGNNFNVFPSHWLLNINSFSIKNYLEFKYIMIHSNDSSQDEDYWYANKECEIDSGGKYPCEEIYFKKNTEIPLRLTQVINRGLKYIRTTTNFTIISIGKPDEKYFDSIPKNWPTVCEDLDLGLSYYPQFTQIGVNQSVEIHISLSAPPHRIDGNDTVRVQWNITECIDCFTLSPKEFTFNTKNFKEKQILRITCVKDTCQTKIVPIFNGGGFDIIPPERFSIHLLH